jgi:hypothetical protein
MTQMCLLMRKVKTVRIWSIMMFVLTTGVAVAADPIPARTPADLIPRSHTHERAGTTGTAQYLQTGIGRFDGFGYVNGSTFGSDFVGFGRRPGRLFPGLWPNGRFGKSFSDKYATDGPIHVPDPIAAKPFRKAVIEARSGSHK